MEHLVEHLTDDYLLEIAAYFAALDLPYPPPQTAGPPVAVLQRGEALVRHGEAQHEIPRACTAMAPR